MTKRFWANTFSSNEDWNGDCDVVMIEVTQPLAERILDIHRARLVAAQALGERFLEVSFYEYSAGYYPAQLAEQIPGLEKESECWTDGGEEIEENLAQRTDCDLIHVSDDDVYWTCSPRHSNVEISTPRIRISEIEEIVRVGRVTA
jgi:hypothetical protein